MDLGSPSAIIQSPASFPQTLETSTLHPSDTDTSYYTAVPASAPVLLTESASETSARKLHLDLTDSGTSSMRGRYVSKTNGVSLNAP